jgi:hypothetical protein
MSTINFGRWYRALVAKLAAGPHQLGIEDYFLEIRYRYHLHVARKWWGFFYGEESTASRKVVIKTYLHHAGRALWLGHRRKPLMVRHLGGMRTGADNGH